MSKRCIAEDTNGSSRCSSPIVFRLVYSIPPLQRSSTERRVVDGCCESYTFPALDVDVKSRYLRVTAQFMAKTERINP